LNEGKVFTEVTDEGRAFQTDIASGAGKTIPTQAEHPIYHSLCHIVFYKLLQNSQITIKI